MFSATGGAAFRFGSSAATTGTFGFGAAAPSSNFGSAPATTGFGSAPATTGFGSAPATTGFGSAFGAPATTGFGSAPTTTGFGSAFGAPTIGGSSGGSAFPPFGQTTAATTGVTAPKPAAPVLEAIQRLQRNYAPLREQDGRYVVAATATTTRNEECRFQASMLNKRAPGSSLQPQLVYGDLLEQAERDNTDPENYVPVVELGIDALKTRFDGQEKESTQVLLQSEKIRDLLRAVRESNQLLHARFDMLKRKQILINKRMLSAIRKVEVLRCHGSPLQTSELMYRDRLIKMLQASELPMKKLQDMSINLVSSFAFLLICFWLCWFDHLV
jgi:hypothetical protein